MRIHLGGDHAAYDTQRDLVHFLEQRGHTVIDHGPRTLDPLDDYPVFVLRAAEAVAAEPGSLGVVLGGSGNGEQIAANKVEGIRAALCYNDDLARLAREHNDAQIISIGARMNSRDEARSMVETFISTPFSGEARHQKRIDMVTAYDTDGTLPDPREPVQDPPQSDAPTATA